MNELILSLTNFMPGRDMSPRARRRRRQQAGTKLKGYFAISAGIALMATLVAVGVSEAASRIAPDNSHQASAFRFAEFANSFMDSMSTRVDPLPVAPPPVLVAAPQAPIQALNVSDPSDPDQASANPSGQEVGKTRIIAKSHIDNVNVTFYDCKNQGF